jgi:uncharacterized protein YndB with AHSA1/START domain
MITFENTVFIERPIEEVFAFVADLQKIPKWNYYVRSVTPTSVETGAVGSTYHQIRKSDEQDLRVTHIDWNKSLVIETIPPSRPELRREMTFRAQDGGTRIVDRWRLNMGVPKLLEPLAANRAKAGVAQNLGKLKVLLETGRVTLQDGRSISL